MHLRVGPRYGVREPDFVVLIRNELVFEAEREVGLHAFARAIVVVEEGVIVVLVALHSLLGVVSVSLDSVWLVRDVFAATEPAYALLLVLPLGPNARLHPNLV